MPAVGTVDNSKVNEAANDAVLGYASLENAFEALAELIFDITFPFGVIFVVFTRSQVNSPE